MLIQYRDAQFEGSKTLTVVVMVLVKICMNSSLPKDLIEEVPVLSSVQSGH